MPPVPPPPDGDYVLTWTVVVQPPTIPPTLSTQSVTYRVTGGVIQTTFGPLTWNPTEGIFAHATLPIGLECTGTHTFTGTSPGLSTVGECHPKP